LKITTTSNNNNKTTECYEWVCDAGFENLTTTLSS
jgi:hypothetical protein